MAGSFLKRERAGHTLQPTALAHEAWLRLCGEPGDRWTDIAHFKPVAVRAMRRVLVDHARRRAADKRGGDWQRVTLTGSAALAMPAGSAGVGLLELERIGRMTALRH